MRLSAVLLAVALGGCAGASALTVASHVGLGVQSFAIACDWGATRAYAEDGWRYGNREMNPIIGGMPSPLEVDVYFLGVLALSALGWHLTPRRWKLIVPIVVTAIQADAIVHNAGRKVANPGVCGIGVLR